MAKTVHLAEHQQTWSGLIQLLNVSGRIWQSFRVPVKPLNLSLLLNNLIRSLVTGNRSRANQLFFIQNRKTFLFSGIIFHFMR